jgi:hypothetical protein
MKLQGDSNLCIDPVNAAGDSPHENAVETSTRAVLQGDAYYNSTRAAWCAKTNGTSATRALLQKDGNFCVINASGSVWCSGTAGVLAKGGYGELQDNGKFCLKNSSSNQTSSVWCAPAKI